MKLVVISLIVLLSSCKKELTVKNKKVEKSYYEVNNTAPVPPTAIQKDTPFGFQNAYVNGVMLRKSFPDYISYINNIMDDLGSTWVRSGRTLTWSSVQPTFESKLDWSKIDNQFKQISVNIMANVGRRGPDGKNGFPKNMNAYVKYLTEAVERYDCDGNKDVLGEICIKYWQIGNEPQDSMFWGGTAEEYADFLLASYVAIKSSCSSCKVLAAGAAAVNMNGEYVWFSAFWDKIFKQLNGKKAFDIFDYHIMGRGTQSDYLQITIFKDKIEAMLKKYGYFNVGFWITEMSTYSGETSFGNNKVFSYQGEDIHAIDLFKRHIYALSNGISKIFWSQLQSNFGYGNNPGGYFDSTGLIYDTPQDKNAVIGKKKAAYFTYKLMTEKLQGLDWSNINRIKDCPDDIYCFQFSKNGNADKLWIIWNDGVSKKIALNLPTKKIKVTVTPVLPPIKKLNLRPNISFDQLFDQFKVHRLQEKFLFEVGNVPLIIEEGDGISLSSDLFKTVP